ncbi:hypothetical protein Tco_1336590 [Tanacetum coccineum]
MTGNLKLLCNFVEKYLDLEDAFRKSTCFVRDLQGNDLLMGTRGSDIYIIALQETSSLTPIFFMAKASPTQAIDFLIFTSTPSTCFPRMIL